ncbi:hypothetical protein K2X89_18145 [Myxococcota bacterium]|nr:hypothetical protein [Myxococcota bacterium]
MRCPSGAPSTPPSRPGSSRRAARLPAVFPAEETGVAREDLEGVIGIGVAGNFAGHLEQAGEAGDFKNLKIADTRAPKGIFPFYVPLPPGASSPHFLHRFPISADTIRLGSRDENHQIEPEVALLCDLAWSGERVAGVTPRFAMAHNDCSIRREGAKKISEKKNWGPESKGTSRQRIAIDRFEKGSLLDHYRIACFLRRAGTAHEYGVDSPVASYSYMYGELLAWLVGRLNDQPDEGPLENVAAWLAKAGRPSQALISIGATQYTDFGETQFLEPGDESIVAVYDARRFTNADVRRMASGDAAAPAAAAAGDPGPIAADGLSLLRQTVR